MPGKVVFSVAQLNEYVHKSLQMDPILSQVEVRGEISNLKFHQSGILFFTLKDEQAAISCMMFQADVQRLNTRPFEGMRASVSGSVSLYVKTGQYRLTARTLRADGVGVLYERLQMLSEKLSREGLFAQERKQALPTYIDTLGVVTSPTGAVIHDIINVSMRRNPGTHILLCPVRVQGSGAAEEIANAIHLLDSMPQVSVIIVARGGGSIEDLWEFNEEVVARACAACKTPIVSAIGHETDNTLCDLASDMRAPTPSAAAELAVPRLDALKEQVTKASLAISQAMENRIRQERHELSVVYARLLLLNPKKKMEERRVALQKERRDLDRAMRARLKKEKQLVMLQWNAIRQQHPRKRIVECQRRLAQRVSQMEKEMHRRIEKEKARLMQKQRELMLLSPFEVLKRGYTIIENENGKPLASAAELNRGMRVSMLFADGQATATVEEIRMDQKVTNP
ncbi:MAG: exodeoxyribonuclease VII large subunit [Clostridia bacterium]|nr:exodeoxyribonuclease VII large subunit [Clostridia bacterium]